MPNNLSLIRPWFKATGPRAQSGRPDPGNAPRVPAWSMVSPANMPRFNRIPEKDHGASGWNVSFGQINYNPIGAGIYANNRPGMPGRARPGRVVAGIAFWSPQYVPTSVGLGRGLYDAQTLQALLGEVNVQAAVRVG